jgi:c-di-GMP-binding flagellar brake protein YcgR
MIFKKKYLEKRAFERENCYCLVRYKTLDEKGASTAIITSLRNISGGGLLLKFKEPHLLGVRVEIKINLPTPDSSAISAVAEIVRLKTYAKAKEHWAGVRFIDIKEEDRKKIIDFIKFRKNTKNAIKP